MRLFFASLSEGIWRWPNIFICGLSFLILSIVYQPLIILSLGHIFGTLGILWYDVIIAKNENPINRPFIKRFSTVFGTNIDCNRWILPFCKIWGHFNDVINPLNPNFPLKWPNMVKFCEFSAIIEKLSILWTN